MEIGALLLITFLLMITFLLTANGAFVVLSGKGDQETHMLLILVLQLMMMFVWREIIRFMPADTILVELPYEGYVLLHAVGAFVFALASLVACVLNIRAAFDKPFSEAPIITGLTLSVIALAAGYTLCQVWLAASEMLDPDFLFLGYTEMIPRLYEKFIMGGFDLEEGLACIPILAHGLCAIMIFLKKEIIDQLTAEKHI